MKSKLSALLIEPGKGVGIDDVHAWRQEGFLIQSVSIGWVENRLRHFRVEVDQGDAFDLTDTSGFRAPPDHRLRQAPARAAAREGPRGRDGSALRGSGTRRAS